MRKRTPAAFGIALLACVLVAGCREEEQGRPLSFEPGVYHGQKDEPISEQNKRDLDDRARLMR